MHTLTSRRPLTPFMIAAALLVAFALLLAWPQPAAAHDALVESDPAADSTIETLPDELTLTFGAALIGGEGSTEVVVTDAAGESVTDGPAEVDGAMVTQPLTAGGEAGEYRVLWKVVSSDGHPTDGEFRFTVTTGSAPETAAPSATPTESASSEPSASTAPPAEEGTPADGDSFVRNLPWIIGGIILAAGLGALIAVLLAKSRREPGAAEQHDAGSDDPAER
ncbi:copper resistance CopC family protein [Microbacterium tenebrionis]|nr:MULTISPECIES: copper resistance CopC family protein [Microbacterium]